MISIERIGKTVKIRVDSGLPVALPAYPFSFDESDENNAELLKRHMVATFAQTMQEARKLSYEAGWKDAKAKRSRSDWFSGWL